MKNYLSSLFFALLLNSCGQNSLKIGTVKKDITNTLGKTINSRFSPPKGYDREACAKNSFAYYLSHFPLKAYGSKVYYYNGQEKPNSEVYVSVLDIDVGNKDLQQCADAVIRLRAEYLFKQKRFNKIHFNFTNNFNAEYAKWAEGYRVKISGNKTEWYKSKTQDYSYKTFKQYLELVFSYAGTLSLSKELKTISTDSIRTGDVFIHGGSPGHAVIVVDVAKHKITGKRIFMIAQSYMPAQNIQLLVNYDSENSPWYDLSKTDKLYSPEWTFAKTELKRFVE